MSGDQCSCLETESTVLRYWKGQDAYTENVIRSVRLSRRLLSRGARGLGSENWALEVIERYPVRALVSQQP